MRRGVAATVIILPLSHCNESGTRPGLVRWRLNESARTLSKLSGRRAPLSLALAITFSHLLFPSSLFLLTCAILSLQSTDEKSQSYLKVRPTVLPSPFYNHFRPPTDLRSDDQLSTMSEEHAQIVTDNGMPPVQAEDQGYRVGRDLRVR